MTPKVNKKRILVKGYMRPDKTSYYVVIPKPVRELLDLEGGEYFQMKVDAKDREIKLKLVYFEEYTKTTEESSETTNEEIKEESSQSELEEEPIEHEF
jgi:AbrB family looped-hinge helix DNA binding protein